MWKRIILLVVLVLVPIAASRAHAQQDTVTAELRNATLVIKWAQEGHFADFVAYASDLGALEVYLESALAHEGGLDPIPLWVHLRVLGDDWAHVVVASAFDEQTGRYWDCILFIGDREVLGLHSLHR
jgi:hypothetical protein